MLAHTYTFRQDKHDTFEAPFVYLLVGAHSALLIDSGAIGDDSLKKRVRATIGPDLPLTVVHTHAHGDHTAGDKWFQGDPHTTVVGPSLDEVKAFYGFTDWPRGVAYLELGDRTVAVVPVPGHQRSHVAFIDFTTHILFSGDTIYPGYLFISDWPAYKNSIAKLADLGPFTLILGSHIEMTRTPKEAYPYRTIEQPDEHALALRYPDLLELNAVIAPLSEPIGKIPFADFILSP